MFSSSGLELGVLLASMKVIFTQMVIIPCSLRSAEREALGTSKDFLVSSLLVK